MHTAMLNRLQEKRNSTVNDLTGILDAATKDNRADLTGEEETRYQKLTEQLSEIDQRVTQFAAEKARAAATEATFAELLAGERAERTAKPRADSELRKFVNSEARAMSIEPDPADGPVNFRALAKGTTTAGGFTVPTTFYGRLMQHLVETSGIIKLGANVLRTNSGEPMVFPITTAHSVAVLIGEGATITASDPAFAQRSVGAYKMAFLFQASSELLADTGVDLEGYFAEQAGRALGIGAGAYWATGTGVSQPAGVVVGASAGVTGAASVVGVPNADNLIDLYFSVIEPYRSSPAAGWLMRDSTLATIRKYKDTTGQYLWQPSYQMGVPDTILGKPVHTDPFMAATALGAKSVLFGDFSKFLIRFAGGVRFEKSVEFAFNTDQTTYRAILRTDSLLMDQTGAVKYFIGNAA